MTKLTLRYLKGYFVISGPEVKPTRFKSGREAKDWCRACTQVPPIEEVATYVPKRSTNATSQSSLLLATTKPGLSPGTAIVHQPRCEPINAGLIRTLRPT